MYGRKSDTFCGKAYCGRPAGIFKQNHDAWSLFQGIKTQLNTHFGGVVGFHYLAVEFVAKTLGIAIDATMFHKLQAMENCYMQILNTPDKDAKKGA